MAAGDSGTSIANLALLALGEDPIQSLDPPDLSKRARIMALLYPPVRRQVLRSGLYGCAKRQVSLAAAATSPPFGFTYAYPLPVDYIRMYDAPENDRGGRFGLPRVMMNLAGIGPCICTDAGAPFDIVHIFDLDDPSQMTADLVMALAKALATEAAIPLAADLPLKSQANADREGMLAEARLTAAQEDSAREWDVDVLLRSRF